LDAADEAVDMSETPIRIIRAAPVRVTRPGTDKPVRVVARSEIESRVRAVPVGLPGEPGADGVNGRDVEIRKTDTHVEWRRVGDDQWQQIIAIDDLITVPSEIDGGSF
jgi:hypothetical protein